MSERVGSQTVSAKLYAARTTAHGVTSPSEASSLRIASGSYSADARRARYRSTLEAIHAGARRDRCLRPRRARAPARHARTVPRRARARLSPAGRGARHDAPTHLG